MALKMNKKEVAEVLTEIGTLLELQNENIFKVRAYYNAARTIESLSTDLETLIEKKELGKLKGIGEALVKKITELVTTGHLKYYEELRKSVPPGLIEMTAIPMLGPKKIKALYDRLNITTIGELEYACRENRLVDLEGFGEKTQENILKGIEYIKKYQERHLYNIALGEAEKLYNALKENKKIIRVSLAGSVRRKKEIIKDIDIVASTKDSTPVMDYFTSLPDVETILAKGDTKSSIRLKSGINSDLRTIPDKTFPYTLHHLTGSKNHNHAMRSRAKANGMKMSEYGLFKGNKLIPCKDEEQIFNKMGLAYIPPELREDMGEIEAAEKREIPELITDDDIRGTFHAHSVWSDGSVRIEALARECQKIGYNYLGMAEHSQSARYANGLQIPDIKKYLQEIDNLNKKLKNFRILKGIEVDIHPDGKLDYPEKILALFDFIIIAVHSKFNMTEAEMTRRIVKAMKNKHPLKMLAHPTGRLLLAREPYPVDMKKIIDEAARNNVAIELNAHPQRLDIDWRWCKYAKEKGVKISINPDAHHIEGLYDIRYGVGIARKGWLSPSDVLNTLSLPQLKKLAKIN